ncbi:MAG: acetate/propionate family kinase [Alphaproteobacteria bacterium]|nr:acetate/propionate family kinase [Alphaproteobacteria bacterium]
MTTAILTINAGSSSIKFALFRAEAAALDELTRGQVEGLGAKPRFAATATGGKVLAERTFAAGDVATHDAALRAILDFLDTSFGAERIVAIGHRVVHGGVRYAEPVAVDDAVMAFLSSLNPLAPLHQPHNLSAVAAARATFPEAIQVACFDTAFHRAHSWVNDTFALPRQLYEEGVRRYGFHGLSYEFVAEELRSVAPHHAAGRLVVAHLGNGASMCALQGGQSVGSTMGFTALDGLPMGTRCGQLDPGVVLYLMSARGMGAKAIEDMLYRQSGLKGLSGLSHDMRELEAAGTPEAMQAIAYFVARIRRELGAMTALLSGLDALAFAGGIGENAWRVREQVCAGFEWLGIELDEMRNRESQTVISSDRSRVRVFVIKTNEERMIARHTKRLALG